MPSDQVIKNLPEDISVARTDLIAVLDGTDLTTLRKVQMSNILPASSVSVDNLGSSVDSGITTGTLAMKTMNSATLEALFDTNAHNLFAVSEGDVIVSVAISVQTATGGASTLDVGIDAAALGTTVDPDAILDAVDLNDIGFYKSDDMVADATQGTYTGTVIAIGPFTVQADGFVTCEMVSGTTQVGGSFVGSATMYYIPA
jgi:hypothetical protein